MQHNKKTSKYSLIKEKEEELKDYVIFFVKNPPQASLKLLETTIT